jgi:hypothetical protein
VGTGENSLGIVNQSGGLFQTPGPSPSTSSSRVYIGTGGDAAGEYNLSGGSFMWTKWELVVGGKQTGDRGLFSITDTGYFSMDAGDRGMYIAQTGNDRGGYGHLMTTGGSFVFRGGAGVNFARYTADTADWTLSQDAVVDFDGTVMRWRDGTGKWTLLIDSDDDFQVSGAYASFTNSTVDVEFVGDYMPTPGQTWVVTETSIGILEQPGAWPASFDMYTVASGVGEGRQLILEYIPEPTSMMLLGLAGFAVLKRQRR